MFCVVFCKIILYAKASTFTFCPLSSVLHGDVHHLRNYGRAVVGSLGLLLERPAADSVLDWGSDLSGHA